MTPVSFNRLIRAGEPLRPTYIVLNFRRTTFLSVPALDNHAIFELLTAFDETHQRLLAKGFDGSLSYWPSRAPTNRMRCG